MIVVVTVTKVKTAKVVFLVFCNDDRIATEKYISEEQYMENS